jgi:signal transduction histidine kinase
MLINVSRYCAVVVAIIPCLALAGWVGDLALLRELGPGGKPMNPLAALTFLVSAVSLFLLSTGGPGAFAGRILGAMVGVTGLLRLIDLATGNQHRIDLLLFRGSLRTYPADPQLTLIAALCFCLVGITLAFASVRRIRMSTVPVAILALYVMAGYLFGGQAFMDMAEFKPMAFNASIAFLLLCTGLAALPPAVPPVSTLALPGGAGSTARRLIPAVLVVPLLLGWLRIEGERGGWFDMGFGTAAFSTLTAVALTLLVLLSVGFLRRSETSQLELASTIRESEQKTFRLLNGLPTGVFVVDSLGRPFFANAKSGEILGRGTLPDAGPGDMAERYQVYRAGTEEPYPAEQIPVVRALRGEDVYACDLEIHRPDRIVPVEVWARPIRSGSGEIELAVATFNDITERLESEKRIEQLNSELARQLHELAQVNKELETFSYSVSHDLRAPLRAIDGFSQVLETDCAESLGPESLRSLGRIRGNVRRMGTLIDDLLRFSRLSRQGLETRVVDMNSVVRNVVEDLSKSRPLTPVITIGELPAAEGDIDLLRQVWTNLIDNAIKYSSKQPDARVEISARTDKGEITYSVRDNGVGFDMAYADKLFGVFQRLHRQDEFEGTGVGLAIVQRVIHRHGGTIWAEASPGGGAAFHFTLPAGAQNGGR